MSSYKEQCKSLYNTNIKLTKELNKISEHSITIIKEKNNRIKELEKDNTVIGGYDLNTDEQIKKIYQMFESIGEPLK